MARIIPLFRTMSVGLRSDRMPTAWVLWSRYLNKVPAWVLVIYSLHCCLKSDSALLLSIVAIQLIFSFLIALESLLQHLGVGPLKSRRLEMKAYCIGGISLLPLLVYQLGAAYSSLKSPEIYRVSQVTLAVCCSVAGNLVLVRQLWKSGLIRNRIRAFCSPLVGLLLLNMLTLFASLIIYLTEYVQLDALLALTSGVITLILISAKVHLHWSKIAYSQKEMIGSHSSSDPGELFDLLQFETDEHM